MGGIAFQLLGKAHSDHAGLTIPDDLGVTIHHPDVQAAPCRTQRADARLPHRHARYELFVGNEANQLVFRAAATRERRGRARNCRDLDEVATVHNTRLKVTREAVVRRLPLPMAVDAETHGVIDQTLGDGPSRDIPVTRRALDAGTQVRRMVEADV